MTNTDSIGKMIDFIKFDKPPTAEEVYAGADDEIKNVLHLFDKVIAERMQSRFDWAPERSAARTRIGWASYLVEGLKSIDAAIAKAQEQKAIFNDGWEGVVTERKANFQKMVIEQYQDMMHRRSQMSSVNIAGPSGFNGDKFHDMHGRIIHKEAEMEEKRGRFVKNTLKLVLPYGDGTSIHGDNPNAIAELQAKLASALEEHEQIKVSVKGDKRNRYQITNSNGRIRAIRERIESETTKQATTVEPFESNRIKAYYDQEAKRLCITFNEGKPSPELIAIMRRFAFKWSPRNTRWQRQDTLNARRSWQWCIEAITKQYAES